MPAGSPERPAVFVDRVSKTFDIPFERVNTLKERALHPLRRAGQERFRALQDVTVDIAHGEFFGIVGRNGSGKSTLLKCLAGIYATDIGDIYIDGRLSAFIELGVGFNPELPARDNIVLNGTMLGLSQREARRRVDTVLDFAELRPFIDLKLKNYSSGMLVRLAFAVMIQVDAEIMLIDEVLAVGDASFQQKCFDEFARIRQQRRTVLLVTHDMGAVNRFCDRAMLLERGRVAAIGDPEAVGSRYLELNFSERARAEERPDVGAAPSVLIAIEEGTRAGNGTAEVLTAWFEEETGVPTDVLHLHHQWAFVAHVRFTKRATDPQFSLTILRGRHEAMFTASTTFGDAGPSVTYEPGDSAWFRVFLYNVFSPGRYFATVSVAHPNGEWMDHRDRLLGFVVTGSSNTGALVQLPYELDVSREPAGAAIAGTEATPHADRG